ncbi:MAG: Fe-S-containing hydro-lyase [Chitinispirillales bacterium]|jgi:fumarate hydratase subunit beta|nr:Fe-S-containing hydro-lyase [Chitinispirillales bacterium]
MEIKKINAILDASEVKKLCAGDEVLISGEIWTARDAAHKRFVELVKIGEKLPIEIKNRIIYFTGPTPAKPNEIIGSAGPTTSGRMDVYSPILIRKAGLTGMIGKGNRSKEVVEAMMECGAVYFAAVGGAAALISKTIKEAQIVAYPELGAEAVRKLRVENFPVIVAIDSFGKSLYELRGGN